MPRKSRIDAPGALQHVIARGINRQRIFRDDPDKTNFLDSLSALLKVSGIKCYAWAVLDNHFHLLLRTGTVPISTLTREGSYVPEGFFAIGPQGNCGSA